MDLNAAIDRALAKSQDDGPRADDHGQLALWLTELQKLKKTSDLGILDKDAEIARLQKALEDEKHSRQVERGHTPHCADRFVYGDGECSCHKAPTTLAEWARVIHQYAKDKGWWDKPRNIGDIFMLFTSEVAEAYEEYRNGHEVTETYFNEDAPTKPEGVPTELADVLIRVLDFTHWAGIDIQAIMAQKHRYNKTRAYRHGGKRT